MSFQVLAPRPCFVESPELEWGFTDDFTHFVDGDRWTKIDGDTGASVAEDADGVGGIVTLTTGGTDNNEAYIHTSNELFDIVEDKPIYIEALLQFSEANTDDANVIFGLMNAVAADHLQDNGGGPAADYSGAVIFKTDGTTVWACESSVSTTQTTNTSKTTAGGSAYQRLGILIQPYDASKAWVTYFVDGKQLEDENNDAGQPFIQHKLTYTSITEMALVVGVKAGDTNSEVVNLDYVLARCRR